MWNLEVSFAIVIMINRLKGLESRVMWRLNVWTRELAAGSNLNDGSFTLQSNLITTT